MFFVLTLGEGKHNPYQPIIDAVLHNWVAMVAFVFVLWATRRDWFGPLPAFLRTLAGLLSLFYLLFSAVALVVWAPLWDFLRLFHVSQKQVQPMAGFAVVGVWALLCVVMLIRGFIRWIGKRYQHQGVAIGFGPLYFYFKRRRAS